MNFTYLKGILLQFSLLFIFSALVACGSGSGGSGSSSGSTGGDPTVVADICTSENSSEDILSVSADSITIYLDDDDCHSDYKSDCDNDHDALKGDHEDEDDDDCDYTNDDMLRITIKGALALQCTDYREVSSFVTANLTIASKEVIAESLDFQILDNGSTWKYKNSAAYAGIRFFTIDWKGRGFEYDGVIRISAVSIGNNQTVLDIDPKSTELPVSIAIGEATIEIDENGVANAYPDAYTGLTKTNRYGTVTAELLFELDKEMSILIHRGNETTEITAAPYFLASTGEFVIKGRFDRALLDGIQPSADFTLRMTAGSIDLTGSAMMIDSEWIRSEDAWKYPRITGDDQAHIF